MQTDKREQSLKRLKSSQTNIILYLQKKLSLSEQIIEKILMMKIIKRLWISLVHLIRPKWTYNGYMTKPKSSVKTKRFITQYLMEQVLLMGKIRVELQKQFLLFFQMHLLYHLTYQQDMTMLKMVQKDMSSIIRKKKRYHLTQTTSTRLRKVVYHKRH